MFTPDKGKQCATNNPLLKLNNEGMNSNWPDTLATMPFNDLKKVTRSINMD